MKTQTKIAILGLISVVSTIGIAAYAADKDTEHRGQFSSKDYKFAAAAAQGGMMEMRAGELARTQGTDPAVKRFGEQMVTDHGKVEEELKALAAKKGATLPATLEPKQERQLERLRNLSGRDFDKAYADSMVDDHKADLKAFKKAADNAEDTDLRVFASKTSTLVASHFEQAKQMLANLKGETTTTPSK